MIDIIGNIKIDESKPERTKYLIACIRSYLFLKDNCKFVLNLDGATDLLYNTINDELKHFANYKLYRESSTNYGGLYCKYLNECNNNYVLNFLEDHFCFLNDVSQVQKLLQFMGNNRVDLCKASFFSVEQKSIKHITGGVNDDLGRVFNNNEDFHKSYQSHYGFRYFIGVNFITTKEFAQKFWCRKNLGARPHDYEISVYEPEWEHRIMFPSFEITESIDDNHGEDGTCLLERNDCPKWNNIWSELTDIELFNIPHYTFNTKRFSNLLHDKTVRQFEENFASYVDAQYAISFNSATSAIFLALLGLNEKITIPSLIPPVVANAILTSGNTLSFSDNVSWVGGSYTLHRFAYHKIIDSAQKVEKGYFKTRANPNDLMIFSFYPTKPVGSCDGGMIVSNDKDKIEHLRELSFNGMSFAKNNWERRITKVGYKMYMNSLQAYMANENLKRLEYKKEKLQTIRAQYNYAMNMDNKSDHLYRINVKNRAEFIDKAKINGIVCGIHYEALHLNPIYGNQHLSLSMSETISNQTVSLPFHEELTPKQVEKIVKFVKKNAIR